MIRRALEALERQRDREIGTGLDREGRVAWSLRGGELLEAAGAWQEVLRARGVRPGERVGIDLPRGPELLAAHLGVLARGATVVPLNPALAPPERRRVLERADLRTLLSSPDRPSRRGGLRLATPPPGSPALLVFTSGTTGAAKGVPVSHAALEANLAALERAWGLTPGDRLVHALPCHHVHGLVVALYGSLRLAIPVVLLDRFDAKLCLQALLAREATVFMGVPTMLRRMTQAPGSSDLPRMRVFISGSAPLGPGDFRAFRARFGHSPLERYGLTETLIVATNPLLGERRPGSVGHPLPGTDVRLAEDGEIEVRGAAVMKGYWRSPGATAEAFRGGFFRTGDLGRIDEAGTLWIEGRRKDLILVGGSNVLPEEVERALEDAPGIEEMAVAGVPDPDLGEVVGAFVVPAAGDEPAEIERRLRRLAGDRLAAYKRPRIYRFLACLPRNAMGKIDRQALGADL